MLRIAVVTRHFPSSIAPTDGRSTVEFVRSLSSTCRVKVFCPFPIKRWGRGIDRSFPVPGVDVCYDEYPAIPFLSRPINGWMAARRQLEQVRAFRPDLIYSVFLYPTGYCALRIASALKVPFVVEGVGSDIHSIGDPISAFYTRKVLRESDYLITVSENLRQLAMRMGARAEASRSVLNGCNRAVFRVMDKAEARAKLGLDPNTEIAVYVGRMDLKKGLRELVEAGALVRRYRQRFEVYIVGDGPDRPAVQKAIDNLGAGKYVHLRPGCSFDEVADWMAAADLITLPSYAEGCPNTVVEALACGRPVVATKVGGIPEIMDAESGCLVPARDAKALAGGFASVLARSWNADVISASHGRDWDAPAAERLEVIRSVVDERRGWATSAMSGSLNTTPL